MALPIFPCSHPQSIVGANELNFCVRDGNRWTLIAINTNYMDKSSRSYRLIRPVARPVCQSASHSNDLCILARNPRPVKHFPHPQATQRSGRERKRRAETFPRKIACGFPYEWLTRGVGDPYRIRTDVKGVRGLCLNHLTNGPWCTFTDSNRGPTD